MAGILILADVKATWQRDPAPQAEMRTAVRIFYVDGLNFKRRYAVKLNWLLGTVFAMALVVPASAQVSIYIRSGPPPIRYEQRTQAPGPEYAWVEGYWAPQGHHYQWVPGRWQQPPYEGAHWNHPHYDHYKQGWQLHEGHWSHEDNDKGRGHDDDHGHGNGQGNDHRS